VRRRTITVLVASLVAAVFSTMPPASGRAPRGTEVELVKAGALPNPTSGFVPGELVVSFRPGLERAEARAVHSDLGSTLVEKVDRGPSTDLVRLPPGASVLEAARVYSRQAEVASAEPNWYRRPLFVPNDTDFSELWGLHNTGQAHDITNPQMGTNTHLGTADADIDAAEAWDLEKGNPDTVIAVIDDGVDLNHPDLQDNIWTNPGESGGGKETNGLDDDGNGFIDDVHGWDFVSEDNSVAAGEHGTHVAGTIAGVTNNGLGISGVCGGDDQAAEPGCAIMPLRFLGPGGGTLADELQAIAYARRNDADIINGSFGGPAWSPAERNAFKAAGNQDGILSVVAAGNDSFNNDMAMAANLFGGPALDTFSPLYPASYNVAHILSVAASNDEDRYGYDTGCHEGDGFTRSFCAFSNFGRHSVDLAAPGVDILSTVPTTGPDYDVFDGTSMASPHVAGVAGLIESNNSALGPLDIKNMIMNGSQTAGLFLNSELDTFLSLITGVPLPNGPQSGQFTRTAGRLNAHAALQAGTGNASPNHDGDIPGAVGIARRKVGTVNWPNDVNDIFRKRLRRGELYRMTLSVPPGRDFDLYLLRPGTVEVWQTGSVLRSSVTDRTGADESIRFQAKRSKIHFIHASTWFTDGSYTLRVRCTTC
jgi:subtilisin family serine protease